MSVELMQYLNKRSIAVYGKQVSYCPWVLYSLKFSKMSFCCQMNLPLSDCAGNTNIFGCILILTYFKKSQFRVSGQPNQHCSLFPWQLNILLLFTAESSSISNPSTDWFNPTKSWKPESTIVKIIRVHSYGFTRRSRWRPICQFSSTVSPSRGR